MKITIQIEDATPAVLKALTGMYQTTPISIPSIPKLGEAQLKKDGAPAKKRGRPAGTTKKKAKV